MTLPGLDQDAFGAAVDLVARTGAKGFEVGYLDDDVPADEARWYAYAQYAGARVTAENHCGPVEAAEALARRLLNGGRCTHCNGIIALSGRHKKGRRCRYRRVGAKWVRGCEVCE